MNQVSINVDDYISEDQKRAICCEAFRAAVAKQATTDLERIISNSAYEVVWSEVEAAMDGKAAETIKVKALQIIDGLNEFSVFRPGNSYFREESKAYACMQSAILENAPALKARIADIISNMSAERISERLSEIIYEVVQDRIIGKQVAGVEQ